MQPGTQSLPLRKIAPLFHMTLSPGSTRPPELVRTELKTLARMSAPVALSQVGLMFTGVVDTLMLGRVGVHELAASALANMWQWGWMAIGLGVVMGLDPLISQAHGRRDGAAAGLALQRGVIVALLVSVPICLMQSLTGPGLLLLRQDPHVSELAAAYNLIKLPTVPCFLVYTAIRQYLQARTLMTPATWVVWLSNIFNALANWVLIFGHLGLPALGLQGAALTSTLTSALMAAGLWLWVLGFKLHVGAWQPWSRAAFSLAGLLQVFKLGLPVGLQISLESWAFSMASFMAGWLGVAELGAHQVVLNMAALAFMMPLGVSQSASARVGNLIGEQDSGRFRPAIYSALTLGVMIMSVSATAFVLLRHQLPLLYTSDAQVLALAAGILPLAGAFQIFDGTQVIAGGLLRGMGKPAAAAWINLVGYYGFALPLGYVLAFRLDWGLRGIWVALATGLTLIAFGLGSWVLRLMRRPLADLRVIAAR